MLVEAVVAAYGEQYVKYRKEVKALVPLIY